jgi:hypothetical protein
MQDNFRYQAISLTGMGAGFETGVSRIGVSSAEAATGRRQSGRGLGSGRADRRLAIRPYILRRKDRWFGSSEVSILRENGSDLRH